MKEATKDLSNVSQRDGAGKLIALHRENLKYVEATWRELMSLVPSTEKRQKRGLHSWLNSGGVGLGLLSSGYNLWATSSLKKHVNHVSKDFESFREQQKYFDKEQVKVERRIVTILRSLDQRMGYEECQDGADLMNLINQRRILGWRFYIEALHRLTAIVGEQ